jgi:hypothetical protein
MIIDKKYLSILVGHSTFEYPPKMYFDFWVLKGNLKRDWRVSSIFHFELGLFGKYLQVEIYYNFKERARTEKEEESYRRVQDFVKDLS